MQNLADALTGDVDRPVLDMTGLRGQYQFTLAFRSDRETPSPDAPESTGASIFTAIQSQLGLKLEPRKASVEMLIVDHVELTPTEN